MDRNLNLLVEVCHFWLRLIAYLAAMHRPKRPVRSWDNVNGALTARPSSWLVIPVGPSSTGWESMDCYCLKVANLWIYCLELTHFVWYEQIKGSNVWFMVRYLLQGAGLLGSFFSIVRGGALAQDDSEIKCEGSWNGELFILVGSWGTVVGVTSWLVYLQGAY